LQAASCSYRIALGPRAGQKVLSLRTAPGRAQKATSGLCAEAHGFSRHAGVRCDTRQRKRLERLCRYVTRPAIANERLECDDAGGVVLQLKSPWRDGTTRIRMSPLEFMQRLAALVPRPRLHLIRFHGALAPNAGLRAAIVPGRAHHAGVPAHEHAHGPPARIGWARLLKRVFGIDLEHCPRCGGELRIIAAVTRYEIGLGGLGEPERDVGCATGEIGALEAADQLDVELWRAQLERSGWRPAAVVSTGDEGLAVVRAESVGLRVGARGSD
jgi:hypothetical protein